MHVYNEALFKSVLKDNVVLKDNILIGWLHLYSFCLEYLARREDYLKNVAYTLSQHLCHAYDDEEVFFD
jgi:hypothetical protein